MGLTASDSGGKDYDPIPQGMFQAVCYSVFDLGTQFNEHFGKRQHKVLIVWEIPSERIQIEKDGSTLDLPRAISREYTLSLGEKANLRKDLQTWRGKAFTENELKGFDISTLLSVNCTLQIIHNHKKDKTYANVAAVMPLMPNTEKVSPENPLRFFSFEDGVDIPEGTPDWIVTKIKNATEWDQISGGEYPPPFEDGEFPNEDDIPF